MSVSSPRIDFKGNVKNCAFNSFTLGVHLDYIDGPFRNSRILRPLLSFNLLVTPPPFHILGNYFLIKFLPCYEDWVLQSDHL